MPEVGSTREFGIKTINTEMVLLHGQMAPDTKGNGDTERKHKMVLFTNLMETFTKDNSDIIVLWKKKILGLMA